MPNVVGAGFKPAPTFPKEVHDNGNEQVDLAALYAKLKYGQRFRTHSDIEKLATAMGRTKDAVLMRMRNFDSLDQSVPGVALHKFAQQTKDVWAAYQCNPEQLLMEAREAYQKLLNGV